MRADSCSACASALHDNRRVIVPDITQYPDLGRDDVLRTFLQMGIRAVQNTPLVSRSGRQVGMLSTQWCVPHEPRERDLRLLDVIARQAADLIERHQTEAALREADRRKNEFLATLAHELRNPLAPLRNVAEILRGGDGDPRVIARVAGVIERQVAVMVRLVDDLLDASRVGRGRIELRREWTDLASVVCHAVEAMRPMCEAKRQQLTVEVPEQPVPICADATRLVQAISNLLGNACKFTKGNGNVHVRAHAREGMAIIQVGDDGIGIDAQHLPRIFDMFTQVDSATDRAYRGLGIGLTLVKTFIEMHGGSVVARSEGLGKGTEFTITLPLAPPAETSNAAV
jgi:signal transduction histidine kinase